MYYLDLKADYDTAAVRELLASKDDSELRQLRVTYQGLAYISDDVGNINEESVFFRFPIWSRGAGYSGIEASRDNEYVAKMERALRDNWPVQRSSYLENY